MAKYGNDIEKGLMKNCSIGERRTAEALSSDLRAKYQDHFLRRTKADIFTVISAEKVNRPLKLIELPLKTDLVVWVPLNKIQSRLYQHIISEQASRLKALLSDG
jgi:SNF2 family DNA or RNA helicase